MTLQTVDVLSSQTLQVYASASGGGGYAARTLPYSLTTPAGTNGNRYMGIGTAALASLQGKVVRGFRIAGSVTITGAGSYGVMAGLGFKDGVLNDSMWLSGTGVKSFSYNSSSMGENGSRPLMLLDTPYPSVITNNAFRIRLISTAANSRTVAVSASVLTAFELDVDDVPAWTVTVPGAESLPNGLGLGLNATVGETRSIIFHMEYPSGEPVVGYKCLVQSGDGFGADYSELFEITGDPTYDYYNGYPANYIETDENGDAVFFITPKPEAVSATQPNPIILNLAPFSNRSPGIDYYDARVFTSMGPISLNISAAVGSGFWTDTVFAQQG